ncbi:MAG: NADP-dependent malic enzyme [Parvibaculales bacterium]
MAKKNKEVFTDKEALRFHAGRKPGKLEIQPTKPMATQRDLSLAYSPGVAAPVLAIDKNADCAYDYTAKGNLVAVVSNGTAILGLGNLGALASKPVMEGKAVLFKRFAGVDSIDIEVDTEDVDAFIASVRHLSPSFGGINLEDIRAPDCFIIEQTLREEMDIPVFHDDQHGTAIICAAGLINSLHLTKRKLSKTKIVINGAGSAGIACVELIKSMGLPAKNAIMCDSKGVLYKGRPEGMNQWQSPHAIDTPLRTLEQAMKGADVALGLSVKGAFTKKMIKSMAKNPIIFAMANPDPEILPEQVAEVRSDAIMATGRSDYPNQINNVLGFPYIFRGALDVRARTINEDMKLACAHALAELAREDVPDEVATAYKGERPRFGRHYIIPVPFDPRLIRDIPPAVAKAAMESGVAGKDIKDFAEYKHQLSARLNPTATALQMMTEHIRKHPKRVIFAEGEEEQVIRAALIFKDLGLGKPVLVAREEKVEKAMRRLELDRMDDLEIINARYQALAKKCVEFVYPRLQRKGYLMRDCTRLVNNDRNVFSAALLAMGEGDAVVTGVTRNYSVALDGILQVIDKRKDHPLMGISLMIANGRTVLVADTNFHDMPNSEQLADIAIQTADVARNLGYIPRVALLSYSTFGYPTGERSQIVRDAVKILDKRKVAFEYDGEMGVDVALNADAMRAYPFCRLSEPANVLVMPAIHSASIATKMLEELGGASLLGPLLVGLTHSVQIVRMGSTVNELVNMAAFAAYDVHSDTDADTEKKKKKRR